MITAALAIARLTSLVAEDELTAPLRTAVEDWARRNPDSVLRDRLAYLTSCSRCVSVWAAGAVLIGQKTRAGRPLVAVLAGSQVARGILTVLDRLER